MKNNKKNSLYLFLLLIIFLFPVITGWVIYHYHDYFVFKTLNHGTLIRPPINAAYLYSDDKIKTKIWRIIYVPHAECDNACKEIYFQLGQVKKALGKESRRVNIILINNKSSSVALRKLQDALRQTEKKDFSVTDKIYLVDPLGNLFMYYASSTNLMDILKDMKKVLEVSQIG